VLVDAGFGMKKAIFANILISGFMFFGAGVVYLISSFVGHVVALLLPLVVGNFIYIAGSDLLPRFKTSRGHIGVHLVMFSLGTLLMYAIPFLKAVVQQS